MRTIDASEFTTERAWGAQEPPRIPDATVRLHWTDQPYIWHVNDGTEVFMVLDGAVDMRVRDDAGEHIIRLTPGRVFVAELGDEHVAHPDGTARVLVVEQAGSI